MLLGPDWICRVKGTHKSKPGVIGLSSVGSGVVLEAWKYIVVKVRGCTMLPLDVAWT